MNRRSFNVAALVGLPFVRWLTTMLGPPKARSGIKACGPEVIVVKTYGFGSMAVPSLRFENVPCGRGWLEVVNRIRPLSGTVNRAHWHGECARTLMLTDWGIDPPENGLCTVVCAFRPAAAAYPSWPSHRPVDFEKEILKALIS
jgi:hypothetical protein